MQKIQYYLLLFIGFCSVAFYKIVGIGFLHRIIEYVGVGTLLIFLLLNIVYRRDAIIFQMHFKWHIIVIFLTVFVSCISALGFHNQSLTASLYEIRPIYYFLFYFLLHYYYPSTKDIEKLIITLAVIHSIIFIMQTFAYPTRITEAKVFFDRGTLRIFMPGLVLRIFSYFYSIDRFLKTNQFKYLILALLFFVVAILTGSRTILALYAGITVLILIFNKSVKNRYALIFLFAILMACAAIIFWNIIEEMILVSEKTAGEGSDYIRIKAAKYFLREFFPNVLTYFTGNGQPGPYSAYGRFFEYLSTRFGFYLTDLGFIGLFVRFGPFFILACLGILIKTLRTKLPSEFMYIKYYYVTVLATSLIDKMAFEGAEGAILITSLLYIVDRVKHDQKLQEQTEPIDNKKNSLKL